MNRPGKKSLFALVALLLVWVAVPATAQKQDNLCAGQHQNVGTVTVTHNASQVFVKYDITAAGAFLTETHAHVANDLAGIPQTGGKNKNPIPGQFSQKATHSPGVKSWTHTFSNSTAGTLYVAAHAVVAEIEGGGDAGVGTIVDQQDPIITVSNTGGAAGSPASAIAFGDGWYSLGRGGQLIAEYRCPLVGGVNAPNYAPDIDIWEKSPGVNPAIETAEIAVSANFGGPWIVLGTAGNGSFADQQYPVNGDYLKILSLGTVTNARYLRVLDNSQTGDANGFDLEAIKSRQTCTAVFVGEETAWGGACTGGTGSRFNTKGNWGTYFLYTRPAPPPPLP